MKVAFVPCPPSAKALLPQTCPTSVSVSRGGQISKQTKLSCAASAVDRRDVSPAAQPTRRVTRASAAQALAAPAPGSIERLPLRPSPSSLHLQRPLVAWDLEATGLSRDRDEIIEFGAVKRFADGRADECVRLRFNPTCEINFFAFKAHGIRASDLRDEPRFESAAEYITTFLSGCDFVGHNMKRFDVPMLGCSLARAAGKTWKHDFFWPAPDVQVLDTYLLFRKFVPDKERAGGNHKLVTCYPYYTHKPLENAHSALADAQACMDVVHAMADAACTGAAAGFPKANGHVTVAALAAFGVTATEASSRRGSGATRPEI